MNTSELSRKYNVPRAEIYYWIKNDLLHPSINEKNGRKEYDEKTEEELKLIFAASSLCGKRRLRDKIEMIRSMPIGELKGSVADKIVENRNRSTDHYNVALQYICDRIVKQKQQKQTSFLLRKKS